MTTWFLPSASIVSFWPSSVVSRATSFSVSPRRPMVSIRASFPAAFDHFVRPGIVGPDHRRSVSCDHFAEQPHLGLEISVHRLVIIEMIAPEIGEGSRRDGQSLRAKLGEAVARGFEGGVRDPELRQARHVGEEGDDVRRGEAGRHLVVGGGDAQRADARRRVPGHAPQLAAELDAGRLAVGAGGGNDGLWKGPEEFGRQPREFAARLLGGDLDSAFDPGLRPRHDRHRAGRYCRRDEVLAIEAGAAKGAEHRARRHLAMVDGKTGDGRIVVASGQRAEPHQCLESPTSGISSDVSMSRFSSGIMPSSGPVREITLATTGAAVQAAVVCPCVWALALGASIMTSTT